MTHLFGHKWIAAMLLYGAVETRLRDHLEEIRLQHEEDLKKDGGYVKLPSALAGKYLGAAREWGWQWVLPSHCPYKEIVTGHFYRHHLFEHPIHPPLQIPLIASNTR